MKEDSAARKRKRLIRVVGAALVALSLLLQPCMQPLGTAQASTVIRGYVNISYSEMDQERVAFLQEKARQLAVQVPGLTYEIRATFDLENWEYIYWIEYLPAEAGKGTVIHQRLMEGDRLLARRITGTERSEYLEKASIVQDIKNYDALVYEILEAICS